MDIQSIVAQLKEELARIENAIAVLAGLGSHPAPHRGRPPKALKKRTMSASARAKISAAQKARWAKQKGKPAPKQAKAAPKKTPVRRPMSAAAKKKLSALMKARWAERKKAQA
jgi:hypothetical protein